MYKSDEVHGNFLLLIITSYITTGVTKAVVCVIPSVGWCI